MSTFSEFMTNSDRPDHATDWCSPRLCDFGDVDVVHREVPTVLAPADDPDHLLSVGLIRADDHGPSGWVEHEPEMAVGVADRVAHLSLAEADTLIALLVAARARAANGQAGDDPDGRSDQ